MEHNMRAHLVRYQVGMNVIKISWFVLFIAVSNTGTVHNSTHAIKWIFRKLEKKKRMKEIKMIRAFDPMTSTRFAHRKWMVLMKVVIESNNSNW